MQVAQSGHQESSLATEMHLGSEGRFLAQVENVAADSRAISLVGRTRMFDAHDLVWTDADDFGSLAAIALNLSPLTVESDARLSVKGDGF